MMLSAEAERSKAVTTARIANEDAAALNARLRAGEFAQLAAAHATDAAVAELAAHRNSAQQLQEAAAVQHSERVAAQLRRISALTEQLEQRNAQLLQCTSDKAEARKLAAECEQHSAELAQALTAAQTDLQTVVTERDGLQLQLAGAPEGSADSRDAAIKDYVSSRVVPLLQYGCAAACNE